MSLSGMKMHGKLTAVVATAAAVVGAGVFALTALGARTASSSTAADTVPGIVDIYTSLYNGAAAGTGIVLTSSGEILTNNHVIRGSTSVRVTDLDNGRKYKAKVVGYSLANDVALLQLANASNLTTANLGDSSSLKSGDAVATYGNAGGSGGAPSVSRGTVTALARSIKVSDDQGGFEQLRGLIETNASLEPGDSGGPMVDSNGKVIGLDTAATRSFSFDTSGSRGYAIPIDHARSIVGQIEAGQTSTTVHIGPTAFMGVSVQPQNDFLGGEGGGSGLTIANVLPGSPSDKAGLEAYDVLTTFDGKSVHTPGALSAIVVTKAPGDRVTVHWVDQYGSRHSGTVTLASGPPQ